MSWATTILLVVLGIMIGAHPTVTEAARPASIALARLTRWSLRVLFVRLPMAAWSKTQWGKKGRKAPPPDEATPEETGPDPLADPFSPPQP